MIHLHFYSIISLRLAELCSFQLTIISGGIIVNVWYTLETTRVGNRSLRDWCSNYVYIRSIVILLMERLDIYRGFTC